MRRLYEDVTDEEKQVIIDRYVNQNMGMRKAGSVFGYSDKIVKKILIEYDIPVKGQGGSSRQRYFLNEKYFNPNNQSHNSAYILGMLASDGNVSKEKNCIYIELQREDKEILEKINNEIQNDREVKDYETGRGYKNSKLYFFSQKVKDDLSLYNIVPNKTYTNKDFLQNIKKEYYIDFIRGFFDGDGSIYWDNGTIKWQLSSTSKQTLDHIQQILLDYGINSSFQIQSNNNDVITWRLYFYGLENNKKLYNLFYSNINTLFMQRKFNKYNDLFKNYSIQETTTA